MPWSIFILTSRIEKVTNMPLCTKRSRLSQALNKETPSNEQSSWKNYIFHNKIINIEKFLVLLHTMSLREETKITLKWSKQTLVSSNFTKISVHGRWRKIQYMLIIAMFDRVKIYNIKETSCRKDSLELKDLKQKTLLPRYKRMMTRQIVRYWFEKS